MDRTSCLALIMMIGFCCIMHECSRVTKEGMDNYQNNMVELNKRNFERKLNKR